MGKNIKTLEIDIMTLTVISSFGHNLVINECQTDKAMRVIVINIIIMIIIIIIIIKL